MSSSLGETINIELVQSPKEIKVTDDSSINSKHQQTVEEIKSSKSSPVKGFNNSRSSDSGKSSSCSPILLDCSFDSGIAGVLLDSNDMQIHKRIQQCQCILLALERDREYYCTIRNRLSKITNRKKKPSNENEFFCNVCCADIDPEDDKTFVKCYICQKYICRSIKCADWLPKTAEWECELCQTSKESLAQTSSWVADQISFHQEKLIHPPRARSEIYIPISECNDSSIHFESVSQIGANSTMVTADQKLKIREYVEEVVAKLLGGNLDTIAVNQLSKSENYLPDPKINLSHNGISPESVQVKASNNDFSDISETRLRQMIQKIIAETMNLPPLSKSHAVSEIALDRRSKSGDSRPLTNGYNPRHRTEHYFEPIIYQDLLATAVLNKIVDTKLNNNHEVSESESGGGGDEVNDNIRHAESDQNLNIEKLSTSSGSSVEPRSDCSYPEIEHALNTNDDKSSELIRNSDRDSVMSDYLASHMIPLPDLNAMATESDEDDYMSVTSSAVGDGTWEKNWLFKKKRSALSNSVTANSVGMLVPDPKEDVRAQIGDKTADEVSDLSELGSDTDDSLDSLRSKLEPINDRLINKHLIGGQNNKMVLDELIERSSMISNTLQSSQDPSYTDACNEHVIDGPIRNEAINDNVTQQASALEQKGDILRAALCSVVLEDPNSNTITASDDNSDSDGCTGFSAIEIIEPTPSVVEILAAMALGPMLAVPSVDQPATLTVSDFNVFTDLKELALAEIKARSLELTPRNLDIIPEETGDITNPIENIIDSNNISTSDETNDRLTINLATAPELEFNTIGSNKEIVDLNSSEISSSSSESINYSTDGPDGHETTDVTAINKTSDIDASTITLTKDQELKETSANENIKYSSTFKSTKSISEKSHLDIDTNTAAPNMEELNKTISKDTELSNTDIGINSKKQLCETHLQKISDYNTNENLSESVALKDYISDEHCLETLSLSAATELQCTSEIINNKASLVLEDSLLADKTEALHEQISKESRSEIKLQDIPDSINNETLSSHLESEDQANSKLHLNNESNKQCLHSEIIVEQNSSEITLQDTSDTTYNNTTCSIQSNTKETLSAAYSKEPEKNTSSDNDSEKPLELNDIKLKGHKSEIQLQCISDSMNSEALSITEENTTGLDNTIPKEQYTETQTEQNETISKEQTSETAFSNTNVESKTDNNITDGNSRLLEETNSKEQTFETQTQQNEIVTEEHCSYIPLEASSDSTNSEELSASSKLNMPGNIEDNISITNSSALDDTVSEIQPMDHLTEQNEMVTKIQSSEIKLEFTPTESNTETNTLNTNSIVLEEIISKGQFSETQMEQNGIVSEEQTSVLSASSEPNVESTTQDIPSDLYTEQQTPQNDNVEEQSSNIQQFDKSDCTNIGALSKPDEKAIKQEVSEIKPEARKQQNETVQEDKVESKNDDNMSKDSPGLTKITSKEQPSEIQKENASALSASSESNTQFKEVDEKSTVLDETIYIEQSNESQVKQNEIVSKELISALPASLEANVESTIKEISSIENTIVIDDITSKFQNEIALSLESKMESKTGKNTSDEKSSVLGETIPKEQVEQNDIVSEELTSAVPRSSATNVQTKNDDNTSDEKSSVIDETIPNEQSIETPVEQNEIVSEELTEEQPAASSEENMESKTGANTSDENSSVLTEIISQVEQYKIASEEPTSASSETNVESQSHEISSIEYTIVINDITSKKQNEIISEEQPSDLSTSSESTMESKTKENTSDEKSSVLDETIPKEQNDIVSEEPISALPDSSETYVETKNDDNTSDEKSCVLDETIPKEQSIETQMEQNEELTSEELTSALAASSEEHPAASSESNMESKTDTNTSDEKSSILDEIIPQKQSTETHTAQNEIVSEELTSALSASAKAPQSTLPICSESNIESKKLYEKLNVLDETVPKEQSFETQVEQNEIVSEELTFALSATSEELPSGSSESNLESKAGENTSDEKSSFLDETNNAEQGERSEILTEDPISLSASTSNCSEPNMESKTSDEKSSILDNSISKEQSTETQVEQNKIVSDASISASSEKTVESKTEEISSIENTIVIDDITSKKQKESISKEQPSDLSLSSESSMESKTGDTTSDAKSNVLDEAIPQEQSIETQVVQNEIVSKELTSGLSASSEEQPPASSESNMEPRAVENTSDEKPSVLDQTIPKEPSFKTQVEQNKIVSEEPITVSSETNVEFKTKEISSIENTIVIDDMISKIQNEVVSEEQPSILSSSSETYMESKTCANTSDEKSRVLDETISIEHSTVTQVEQNGTVSEEATLALSASSKEQPPTLFNSSVSKMESKAGENTLEVSSVLPETITQEPSIETLVKQNEIVLEEVTSALSASSEEQPPTLSHCSESNMESQTSDEISSVLPETITQKQSMETPMEQNEIVSEEVTSALSASLETNVESKTKEISSIENTIVIDDIASKIPNEIISEEQPPTLPSSSESYIESKSGDTSDEKSNVLNEAIPQEQFVEIQMEQNEIVSEEVTSALSVSAEEQPLSLYNYSESNMESITSDEKSSVLDETISMEHSNITQVEQNEIVSEAPTLSLSASAEEQSSTLSNSSESNVDSKTSDENSSVGENNIPKEQSIETQVEQNKIVSEAPISASPETNVEFKTKEISSIENTIVIDDMISKTQNVDVSEEQPSILSSSSETNMESKTCANTSDEKSRVFDETISIEHSTVTQVEQNETVSEEATLGLSASSKEQPPTLFNSSVSKMESKAGENTLEEKSSVLPETITQEPPIETPSSSESYIEFKSGDTSDEKSNVLNEAIPQEQFLEIQMEQNEIVSEEVTSALSASAEEQSSTLSNSSESNVDTKTSVENSSVLDETISIEHSNITQVEQNKIVSEAPISASPETNVEFKIKEISSIENTIVIDDMISKTQNVVVSEEQLFILSPSSESNMESKTGANTSDETSSVLDETISIEHSTVTQVEQNETVSEEATLALSASSKEQPPTLFNSSESKMESKSGENTLDEKSSVLPETITQEPSIETLVKQNETVSEEATLALSASSEEQPSTLFHCSESNTESQTSDDKSSVLPETIPQEQSMETPMEQNEIVSEEVISALSASLETNVESKTNEISSIENTIVIDDITSKIQNEIIYEEQPPALPSSSESNIESKSGDTSDEKSNVLNEAIPQEQFVEIQMEQNEIVSEEPTSASSETNVESQSNQISSIEHTIVIDDITSKIPNEIISEEQPSDLFSSSESNIVSKTGDTLDVKSNVLDDAILQEKSIETQVEQNEIVAEELTSALSASSDEQPSTLSNSSEISSVLNETIPQDQSIEIQVEKTEIVLEAFSASSIELPLDLTNSSELNMESKISNDKSRVLDEAISKEQSYETQVKKNKIFSEEPTSIENTIVIVDIASKLQNEIVPDEHQRALSSESNMESKTGYTTSHKKSVVLDDTIPQKQSIETQVEQNEIVSEELSSALSDSSEEQPSALPTTSETNIESKILDEKSIVLESQVEQIEIASEELTLALSASSEANVETKTSNEISRVLDNVISEEQSYETQVEQNKIVSEEATSALSYSSETNVGSKTEEISSIENTIVIDDITSKIQNEIVPDEQPSKMESNMESKTGDNTSDKTSIVLYEAIPQEQSIETQVEQNKIISEELTSAFSASAKMDSKTGENIETIQETIPPEPSIETQVNQIEIVSEELTLALSGENTSDEKSSDLTETISQVVQNKIVSEEPTSASSEKTVESKTKEISSIEYTIVIGDLTSKIQNEIISEEQPSALSTSSESTMEFKTEENTSDEKASVLDETIPKEQVEQNDIVSEEPTSALSASSETNVESKTEEISSTENTIIVDDIKSKIQNEILLDEQPSDLSLSSESNIESKTGDTTSDKNSIVLDDTIPQKQSIEMQVEQNEIVSEELSSALSDSSEEQPSALPTTSESNIESKILDEKSIVLESQVEQIEIVSEKLTLALSASSEANVETKTSNEISRVLDNAISEEQSYETQVEQNKIVSEEATSALSDSSETNVESKTEEISSTENTIIVDDIKSKIQNEILLDEQPSDLSLSSESNIESKTGDTTSDKNSIVLDDTIPQKQSIEMQVEQNEIVSVELSSALSTSSEEQPEQSSESNIETISKEQCNEIEVEQNETVSEQQTLALSASSEANVESNISIVSIENTSKKQNEIVSESNKESKPGDNTAEKSNVIDETIPKEQSNETPVEQNKIVSVEQPSALSTSSESNMESKTEDNKQTEQTEIVSEELSTKGSSDSTNTEALSANSTNNEELPECSEDKVQSNTVENTSDKYSSVQSFEIISEGIQITPKEQSSEILQKGTAETKNNGALYACSESNAQPESEENSLDKCSKGLDITVPVDLESSNEFPTNIDEQISIEQPSETHRELNEIISKQQSTEIQLQVISDSANNEALFVCPLSNMQTNNEAESSSSISTIQSKTEENISDDYETISKGQLSEIEPAQNEKCLGSIIQPIIEENTSDEYSKILHKTISSEQPYPLQTEQHDINSSEQSTTSIDAKTEENTSNKCLIGLDETISCETQPEQTKIDSKDQLNEISKEQNSKTQPEQNETFSNEQSTESANNEAASYSLITTVQSKSGESTSYEHLRELDETVSIGQHSEIQPEQNEIISEEKSFEILHKDNSDFTNNKVLSPCSVSIIQSTFEDKSSDEYSKGLHETIPKEQSSASQSEQHYIISNEQSTKNIDALSGNSEYCGQSKSGENSSNKWSRDLDESISIEQCFEKHSGINQKPLEYISDSTKDEILPETSESSEQPKPEDIILDEHSKVLDDINPAVQYSEIKQKQTEIVVQKQSSEISLEDITKSLPACSESSLETKTEENTMKEHSIVLDEIISKVNTSETQQDQSEITSNEQSLKTPMESVSEALSTSLESTVQSKTEKNMSNECLKGFDETNSNEQSSEKQQHQIEIMSKEQTPEMSMNVNSDLTDNESLSMNSESIVQLKTKDNTLHEDSGEPQQKEVILDSTDSSDGSKSYKQHEIEENISNDHSKLLDEIICKEQPSEILQNNLLPNEQTSEMPLKDISNPSIKQQSELQSSVMQLQNSVDPSMNEPLSGIPESYVQANTEENSSDECSKVLDEIISKEQSSETQQEQIEVVIKEQQSEMLLNDISNPTSNEQNEIVSKEHSSDIQTQITLDPMNNEPLTDSSESNVLTTTNENTSDEHLNRLHKTVSNEQLSEIALESNSNSTNNEILSENSESNAQSTFIENISDGLKDISKPTINEQNEPAIQLQDATDCMMNEALSESSVSNLLTNTEENSSAERSKVLDETIFKQQSYETVSKEQPSETLPLQNEINSKEQSPEISLECNSNSTNIETLSKNSVSKEEFSGIQPKQNKIVLCEKSSEIALENIDSTHNDLLKELTSKGMSSESKAEQKDIVLKEQPSDIQLQTVSESNVQSKAEGNTFAECSKECNEIILEIQHSEIKLEESAKPQLKSISEHKSNDDITECLASKVQIKTEQNNLTEYSEELNEQISKEHLSILDKHDSSKHEALTKDSKSSIQCKSTDSTTADILGELNPIDLPTTNTSTIIVPNLHTTPVPTIVSESEYNPKLGSASGNFIHIQDVHGITTDAATFNTLEDQISLDDSPTISRQSTVVEIEEDNNKAAAKQPQDQLSYDSKPYADSRTNTIEEYFDNDTDEKDILAINYNNNSTTNTITTATITTITTTTTNSSTETNAKANTNHYNTNNHKQPITNMSGGTATTTSNQMRPSDPLTSAVQNNETSSHSQCVQQLITNDQVNVQILTDARDKNNIDGVGVYSDDDAVRDDGVINDNEEEDDDDDVAILRHFLPGSIAEREYKKWYNAVEMPNNPYAPEALKRRISGSQERFIDLPNISPTKDLNPLDLLDNQNLEADENMTRESDYKRYSRDYYINSSLTTPQLSPARDVSAHATKKDIREPTRKTLSSTENETELDLYKAIPAQVIENNSSSTDVMSPLSGELEGNTTTTSDDSDTIKMYDFKTQQETIKDATITNREQTRVDEINSKERPSSLAFNRSESSVNIVTPTRGSTPMAFKFLQPKRKLLEPNQVLSVEENEPQIVSSPSEKPVIEAEVAKAMPSVKALARAFLMTTKASQPEKLWLRKARTLSQGGNKRSYSPKRSLDHLMKSEQSKPEDDITITSDLSSLETDSSSIGIEIANSSDVSTPAISSTNDPSLPTDTGNISPVPVRQGVLKNNIAFFENLKNK